MAILVGHVILSVCLMATTIFAVSPLDTNSLDPRNRPIGLVGQNVCNATELPHGPKLKCGYQGHLKHPVPHSTSKGLTYEQCRDACLVSAYQGSGSSGAGAGKQPFPCIVFSYEETTQTCAQYPDNVDFQPGRRSQSGVRFWNRHCFKVTYYQDEPSLNPGFETGSLEGWIVYYNNRTASQNVTVVGPGFNSDYAAQITLPDAADAPFDGAVELVPRTYRLCKGVKYTYFWSYYQVPGETDAPANMSVSYNYPPAIFSQFNQPSGTIVYDYRVTFNSTYSFSSDGEAYPAGQWISFSYNFTADSSGIPYVVVIVESAPNTTLVVNIDNIFIHTRND